MLVNDLIWFDTEAENSGQDILHKGNINLVPDNLKYVLDFLADLPFVNEGIHLVFDDGRHQGNHLFKLFVINTEDCNNLVSRQHQIFFKSHRVRNFILRKGFALNGRIGTQCHSVLLDGAEFVEGVAQGVHHFFLHARLEVIGGLNLCCGSFLLFLCADNIHNVLCGVDGFMGDFADAQVVFFRNADNKEQDENQEECDNSHQDTLETRRTKPF